MERPLKKILIANRGEIALRIIRTTRKMGISTVSLYTEIEAGNPWSEESDESFSLGKGTLLETWLNIEKIIDIAVETGCDAIHPGYGFLAENSLFAEACHTHNIAFIGPPASILKLMGDKINAREWAGSLGIPVPESFCGNSLELLSLKDTLPYPVIVKAVVGGGGKGMRLVSSPDDIENVLKTTSNEALQYFGDNRIYIEKYIENARHIEIQILADKYGNAVHLFERECSVQRRHQKLIEESPSSVPAHVLNELIHASLQIARSVKYEGAGTVEFLVEPSGKYYFLEVNPRIQVEHGVTELITGVDMVAEQIKIAAGFPLALKQQNLKSEGHAIEARMYAEDPENDLLPSPGIVHELSFPEVNGLRLETSVRPGSAIAENFDPLVAKILIHANSRSEAVELLKRTVKQTAVTGIHNNLALLDLILSDPDFKNEKTSTVWLNQKLDGYSLLIAQRRKVFERVSLCGAAFWVLNSESTEKHAVWNSGFWRNVNRIRFRADQGVTEIEYERTGPQSIDLYINEERIEISDLNKSGNRLRFLFNGRPVELYARFEQGTTVSVSDGHLTWQWPVFALKSEKDYVSETAYFTSHSNMVKAPQPGTVLNIRVSEGQRINRGDYLLTIESMKLENTIMATCEGMVEKIAIKTGDRVKKDEPLIYLQDSINN
ncbi:MAG TPA: biotin carboxylase N-terminal domain-containing protein [Bacteroidales bacterium]|nr:biotin carboxylase N-terminal domain-containing protein [Bacteroidales bacterium]